MPRSSPDPDPQPAALGYCPHCGVPVPDEFVLIEYEREQGRGCYAECPACRDVVRPAGTRGGA